LGKLSVLSQLGQPLRAEIEILSLQKGEGDTLGARLAPGEVFRSGQHRPQSGIDVGQICRSATAQWPIRGDSHLRPADQRAVHRRAGGVETGRTDVGSANTPSCSIHPSTPVRPNSRRSRPRSCRLRSCRNRLRWHHQLSPLRRRHSRSRFRRRGRFCRADCARSSSVGGDRSAGAGDGRGIGVPAPAKFRYAG